MPSCAHAPGTLPVSRARCPQESDSHFRCRRVKPVPRQPSIRVAGQFQQLITVAFKPEPGAQHVKGSTDPKIRSFPEGIGVLILHCAFSLVACDVSCAGSMASCSSISSRNTARSRAKNGLT